MTHTITSNAAAILGVLESKRAKPVTHYLDENSMTAKEICAAIVGKINLFHTMKELVALGLVARYHRGKKHVRFAAITSADAAIVVTPNHGEPRSVTCEKCKESFISNVDYARLCVVCKRERARATAKAHHAAKKVTPNGYQKSRATKRVSTPTKRRVAQPKPAPESIRAEKEAAFEAQLRADFAANRELFRRLTCVPLRDSKKKVLDTARDS